MEEKPVTDPQQSQDGPPAPKSTLQEPPASVEAPKQEDAIEYQDEEVQMQKNDENTSKAKTKQKKPPVIPTKSTGVIIAVAILLAVALIGLGVVAYVQSDIVEPSSNTSGQATDEQTEQTDDSNEEAVNSELEEIDEALNELDAESDFSDEEINDNNIQFEEED